MSPGRRPHECPTLSLHAARLGPTSAAGGAKALENQQGDRTVAKAFCAACGRLAVLAVFSPTRQSERLRKIASEVSHSRGRSVSPSSTAAPLTLELSGHINREAIDWSA
jgi:hypothetical protein